VSYTELNQKEKIMKNLLIFLLSVSIFSASCKSSTNERPQHQSSNTSQTQSFGEVVHLGGTLRQSAQDPTKWCWIVDGNHTPVGFDSSLCGTAQGNKITLPYGVTYSKVVTLQVSPDESLLNLGMQAGASVGLGKATIYFTCYGVPCSMDTPTGYQSGNLWISGLMIN
jgi:hypothetical protein